MGSRKQESELCNLPVELSAISRTLPDEPGKPIQYDGLPDSEAAKEFHPFSICATGQKSADFKSAFGLVRVPRQLCRMIEAATKVCYQQRAVFVTSFIGALLAQRSSFDIAKTRNHAARVD